VRARPVDHTWRSFRPSLARFTTKATNVDAAATDGGHAGMVGWNRTGGSGGCGALVNRAGDRDQDGSSSSAARPGWRSSTGGRQRGAGLPGAPGGRQRRACPVATGAAGHPVTMQAAFDGRDYTHPYINNAGKVREFDILRSDGRGQAAVLESSRLVATSTDCRNSPW